MTNASCVILNTNVMTLNSKQPKAEALAIQNGKITAIDSNKEIRKYVVNETKIVDAENRTVIPGLVDCHVHMTGFGQSLQRLGLRNAKTIEELQRKLREYAEKHPEIDWVLGRGWDQDEFAEKHYPTRWDLDKAIAHKPVFLTRVCGHIGVANSKALELASITKNTSVTGGKIDLDETADEPNGILRENAVELIWRVIPKPTLKELENTCLLACRKAVEAGLTGVHWIADSADEIRIIQKLHSDGKLPLRVYLGIPVELLDEIVKMGLLTGFGNDMIKIGFIKILADGSLGAHTAALKKPYSDKPDTKGMMLYSQKRLNKLVSKAHEAGLQLAIHAIGDRAIDDVLKAFSKALRDSPRKNHRHRIEHCSVLNPRLIKRMKRLGLVASVQPHFVVSDFWVVDRVGKVKARWTYPFKTLIREGMIVCSGSDCPVEPINPLLGIWSAVARKSFPEETLTLEEALKTYALNAAYASFEEDNKGSIEVGKFADLVILSEDLSKIPPDKIKDVSVETVMVDGKTVYSRQ